MIEGSYKKIVEFLWFPILFIILWSAVLGLPHVPAWNEFVTWFGKNMPGNEFSMQAFFGDVVSWITSFNTIDIYAIRDLMNGGFTDGLTVIRALGFIVNIATGFLPTVAMLVYGLAMSVWYVFNNVLPLIFAFAYFLGGNLVSNYLPGVMSPIDWSAQSGWFGYPDQSFVALFSSLPCLVG